MKITFLQDHQSVLSDNEFYRQGAQAHLRGAAALIAMGVAVEVRGNPEAATPELDTEPEPQPVAVDDLTRIRGIGANTAHDLASFGVDSFVALANGDAEAIAAQLNGSSVRQVQGWQKQARELM